MPSDVAESLVQGDEHSVLAATNIIDYGILRATQPLLDYGLRLMAGITQQCCNFIRQILVDLEAQLHSLRKRDEALMCELSSVRKCRLNIVERHRRIALDDL